LEGKAGRFARPSGRYGGVWGAVGSCTPQMCVGSRQRGVGNRTRCFALWKADDFHWVLNCHTGRLSAGRNSTTTVLLCIWICTCDQIWIYPCTKGASRHSGCPPVENIALK